MSDAIRKPPEALDRIADKVLAYRPKDKARKLRKKVHKGPKAQKGNKR